MQKGFFNLEEHFSSYERDQVENLNIWNSSNIRTNFQEIISIIKRDDLEEFIESTSVIDLSEKYELSSKELSVKPRYLIDIAAFYSAVRIYKYLYTMVGINEKTIRYAIKRGNIELIFFSFKEQNASLVKVAIYYHRNEVLNWLLEQRQYEYDGIGKFIRFSIDQEMLMHILNSYQTIRDY